MRVAFSSYGVHIKTNDTAWVDEDDRRRNALTHKSEREEHEREQKREGVWLMSPNLETNNGQTICQIVTPNVLKHRSQFVGSG